MDIDSFCTKDLNIAALLYASKVRLIKPNNDAGRTWFIFAGKAQCEKLADAFWRREAMVNAKEFTDAQRSLKDIIFNQ